MGFIGSTCDAAPWSTSRRAACCTSGTRTLTPRRPPPGAYTRPLFSSTLVRSVEQGVHVGIFQGYLGGVWELLGGTQGVFLSETAQVEVKWDGCKPLPRSASHAAAKGSHGMGLPSSRGLHSFRFQLNLSSSVHRVSQLNSWMCPGVAQVEL